MTTSHARPDKLLVHWLQNKCLHIENASATPSASTSNFGSEYHLSDTCCRSPASSEPRTSEIIFALFSAFQALHDLTNSSSMPTSASVTITTSVLPTTAP